MIQVTAVGVYCMEHWTGPKLDTRALTEALLLHDMANIIKFKRPFLGELEKRAAYWQRVQEKYIETYGNDVPKATLAIVCKIGVHNKTIDVIRDMATIALEHNLPNRWEAKIGDFCDTCVTPEGISGFEVRIQDLMKRYNLKPKSKKILMWRENVHDLEKYFTFPINEIPLQDYAQSMRELQTFGVRTRES